MSQEQTSPYSEERRPPMKVVGREVRTDNPSEMEGAGKIAGLWGEFASSIHELEPFGITGETAPVAVYHDYESDHLGPYTLLVGVPWTLDTAPPPGWVTREIPDASCHVWRGEGEIPGVVFSTWQAIWTHYENANDTKRSFTFDVERYVPGGLEIWLSAAPVMLP